ncbi:MAG: phytanoyl-CoA dioxygenase family protein [Caldilineaceae bacterium]|nr:phytanoyl-CoA dioxygenase family protein [Caldilineaceae bacterium]
MIAIDITPEERRTGQLPPAKVAIALQAMAEDGVVALRQAIPLEPIEQLGAKMLADLADYEALYEIDNNFQGVRPPPFQPFLFADIIFNEPAITLSRAILGEGATLISYGANTAFVGAQTQQVHADAVSPEPGPMGPCNLLVINVPLVDMTEENGATIYWPGTHHDVRLHSGNRFPTEEMIAEWEAKRPAERVVAQRGDLVLRDMRVWHGGMPNRTQTHRPMLALVHRNEKPAQGTFEAEAGSEAFWASHPRLQANPAFLAKPIDYLRQGHSRPGKK